LEADSVEACYWTMLACLSADGGRVGHGTKKKKGVKQRANGLKTSVASLQASSREHHKPGKQVD